MNPIECPPGSWNNGVAAPGAAAGGYSVAVPFPVTTTPGLGSSGGDPDALDSGSILDLTPAAFAALMASAIGGGAGAAPGNEYVANKTEFGFFNVLRGNAAAADFLVLPQPDTRRVFLLIVNLDVANALAVQFGGPASANGGLILPPNYGSILFDKRVPQDDIHIVAVAGTPAYQVLFSNRADFT